MCVSMEFDCLAYHKVSFPPAMQYQADIWEVFTMKRFLAAALSLCMMLSLCSCSSKPKTASELLTHVQESMDGTSYSMSGTIDMDMSVGSGGFSMDMPISVEMDGDVFGDASHASMVVSVEMLGQEITIPTEVYVTEDGASYSYTEGEWTVSETSAQLTDMAGSLTDADLFAEAEMSEEEGVYTVILPLSAIDPSIFDDIFTAVGSAESVPAEDFAEMMADGLLTYVITGDGDSYLPAAITLEGMSGEFEQDDSTYTLDLSMNLEFSNFNGVTEADVAVPDEALESAVPESENTGGEAVLLPNGNGESNEAELETEEPSGSETQGTVVPTATEEDYSVVYNGVHLVPGTFSLDVFLDEFTYDPSELGTYMFLDLTYKANDMVSLYVYGDDYDSSDLETAPIWEYDFEYVPGYEADGLPDVTFGGLTWGASREKVEAVYGEAGSTYTSGDTWNLYYELGGYEEGYTHGISFTGDSSGVYSVNVKYYTI